MKLLPFRCLLLCSLVAISLSAASGQVQHTMHRTFTVDSVDVISVDFYDPYDVEFWPGSKIMLRTSINLYGAKESVLTHFVESGRYSVKNDLEDKELLLTSEDQTRPTIRAGEGECYEAVELVLYLPEEFQPNGEHRWRRNITDAPQTDTIN